MTVKRSSALAFSLALLTLPLGWLLADKPPVSSQLEKSLFEDLSATGAPAVKPTVGDAKPPLPGPLPKLGVEAGEDLGRPDESDPFSPIELRMRRVHRLLADGDTGRETQLLQINVVQQLERLQRAAATQQQDQAGLLSNDPGSQAGVASSNSAQGGVQSGLPPPPEHLSPAIKRIWGSLPPDVRSQLRGAGIERFLPKYESMLEQFYRRLSAPR
jgi:hypothetical protein